MDNLLCARTKVEHRPGPQLAHHLWGDIDRDLKYVLNVLVEVTSGAYKKGTKP